MQVLKSGGGRHHQPFLPHPLPKHQDDGCVWLASLGVHLVVMAALLMSSVERAAFLAAARMSFVRLLFLVVSPHCLLCAVCWGQQTGHWCVAAPPCGGASLTPPGVCLCLPCRSGLYSHAHTTLSLHLSACKPACVYVCMIAGLVQAQFLL